MSVVPVKNNKMNKFIKYPSLQKKSLDKKQQKKPKKPKVVVIKYKGSNQWGRQWKNSLPTKSIYYYEKSLQIRQTTS